MLETRSKDYLRRVDDEKHEELYMPTVTETRVRSERIISGPPADRQIQPGSELMKRWEPRGLSDHALYSGNRSFHKIDARCEAREVRRYSSECVGHRAGRGDDVASLNPD